jgi:hypothetical protein
MTTTIKNALPTLVVCAALSVGAAWAQEAEQEEEVPQSHLLSDTQPAKPEDITFSGFLDDYSKLKPGGPDRAALLWVSERTDFSKYHSFIIEQPLIYLAPAKGDQRVAIDPKEMSELADYFRDQVVEALGDNYPVVQRSGPGVGRVRLAITEVDPVSTGGMVVKWITKVNLDLGSAAMEVELLDSVTGEQLAAAVDERVGTRIGVTGGLTPWSHTKAAFRTWAQRFRERVDAWHGVTPASGQ